MKFNKILFLSNGESVLFDWLLDIGEDVQITSFPITSEYINIHGIDFLVSYGYRHLIAQEVLDLLSGKAINLHISLLPWNRGADPNLWSFIGNTPKGVTIHYINNTLDAGDIIFQKEVEFEIESETLRTSYEKLHQEVQKLFKDNWHNLKIGKNSKFPQIGEGSFHKSIDKDLLNGLLVKGWDTSVRNLEEFSAENEFSSQFIKNLLKTHLS